MLDEERNRKWVDLVGGTRVPQSAAGGEPAAYEAISRDDGICDVGNDVLDTGQPEPDTDHPSAGEQALRRSSNGSKIRRQFQAQAQFKRAGREAKRKRTRKKLDSFADMLDRFAESCVGNCCRYKAPWIVWYCAKILLAAIYVIYCLYRSSIVPSRKVLKSLDLLLRGVGQVLCGICVLVSVATQVALFVVLYLFVSKAFRIDLDVQHIRDLVARPYVSGRSRAKDRVEAELQMDGLHLKGAELRSKAQQLDSVLQVQLETAARSSSPRKEMTKLIVGSKLAGHWLITWEPASDRQEVPVEDSGKITDRTRTAELNSAEEARELHSLQIADRLGRPRAANKEYDDRMERLVGLAARQELGPDEQPSGATLVSGAKALAARNWAPFTRVLCPQVDRTYGIYALHAFDNGLKAVICSEFDTNKPTKSGCLSLWDLVEGAALVDLTSKLAESGDWPTYGVTALTSFEYVDQTQEYFCDRLVTCSHNGQVCVWDLTKGNERRVATINPYEYPGRGTFVVGSVRVFAGGHKALLSRRVQRKEQELDAPHALHILELHDDGQRWTLGTKGFWHDRAVWTIEVCGQRAVSCCKPGQGNEQIKLWDLRPTEDSSDRQEDDQRVGLPATGTLLNRTDLSRKGLNGHDDAVKFCTIFSEGRRALSCSKDFTLKMWDLRKYEDVDGENIPGTRCVATFRGHTKRVHSCAVLGGKNGEAQALSCSDDGSLRLWDLLDTARASVVMQPSGEVAGVDRCIVFPESPCAVAGHRDGLLRVWNLVDYQCMLTLRGHTDGFCRLACLDSETRFVSASKDGTVRVWDLAARERRRTVALLTGEEQRETQEVTSIAPFSNGRFVLAGYHNGKLRVHDLVQQRVVATVCDPDGDNSPVESCAVSKDSRFALSGSRVGKLRKWTVFGDDGKLCLRHDRPVNFGLQLSESNDEYAHHIILFDDDRRVLLSIGGQESFRGCYVYDEQNPSAVITLKGTDVCFQEDQKKKYSKLKDRLTLQMGASVPFTVYRTGVELHKWRLLMCTGGYDAPALKMWDLDSGEQVTRAANEQLWRGLDKLEMHEPLEPVLSCMDKPEMHEPLELQGHKHAVLSCAVFPGGQQAVSCSESELIVWDLVELNQIVTLDHPVKHGADRSAWINDDGRDVSDDPGLISAAVACHVVPDATHIRLIQHFEELVAFRGQQNECSREHIDPEISQRGQKIANKAKNFIQKVCNRNDPTDQIKRQLNNFEHQQKAMLGPTPDSQTEKIDDYIDGVIGLCRDVISLLFFGAQVLTHRANGTVRISRFKATKVLWTPDVGARARMIGELNAELVDEPGLQARYCEPKAALHTPLVPVNTSASKVTCHAMAHWFQSDGNLQAGCTDLLQLCVGRRDGRVEAIDLSRIESHAPCARTVWKEMEYLQINDEREGRSWKKHILLEAVLCPTVSAHVLYQRDRDSMPPNQTLVHKIAQNEQGGELLLAVVNEVERREKEIYDENHKSAVTGVLLRAGTIRDLDTKSALMDAGLSRYIKVVESLFSEQIASLQQVSWLNVVGNVSGQFEQWQSSGNLKEWQSVLEMHGMSLEADENGSDLRSVAELLRSLSHKTMRFVHKTALAVALASGHETCVQFLLEDYRQFVANGMDLDFVSSTGLKLIPQGELTLALKTYPDSVVPFLQALELKPSRLTASSVRCDLDGQQYIVEAHQSAFPSHPYKQLPWWDFHIEQIWKHSSARSTDVRARKYDNGWGVPVLSHVVPIAGIESLRRRDEELSFTRLLQAAVAHATRDKTPQIFNSEVMKVIVEQKWSSVCGHMFHTMCYAYAIYLLVFTWVVVALSSSANSDDGDHALGWAGWWFVFVYTLLLINRERFQLQRHGFKGYFRDEWNYLDLLQQALMLAALLLVHWRDGTDFDEDIPGEMSSWLQEFLDCKTNCRSHINATQGLALLCAWLKSLYYLRGFKSTASVVNMLRRIFKDMVKHPFLFSFSSFFNHRSLSIRYHS